MKKGCRCRHTLNFVDVVLKKYLRVVHVPKFEIDRVVRRVETV